MRYKLTTSILLFRIFYVKFEQYNCLCPAAIICGAIQLPSLSLLISVLGHLKLKMEKWTPTLRRFFRGTLKRSPEHRRTNQWFTEIHSWIIFLLTLLKRSTRLLTLVVYEKFEVGGGQRQAQFRLNRHVAHLKVPSFLWRHLPTTGPAFMWYSSSQSLHSVYTGGQPRSHRPGLNWIWILVTPHRLPICLLSTIREIGK